jgi:hypothetical protein
MKQGRLPDLKYNKKQIRIKTNKNTIHNKIRMGRTISMERDPTFFRDTTIKARCRASRLAWKYRAEAPNFKNL